MKTYVFCINQFTRIGESNVYSFLTVREQGATFEEAKAKVVVPEGHRVFCSWVDEPYGGPTV